MEGGGEGMTPCVRCDKVSNLEAMYPEVSFMASICVI